MLRRVQLVIVRHAEAAPGEPDELRPLTPAGRETARALGKRLSRDGVRLDAVVTSPLLRARETARELARASGVEVRPDERLAPGATAEDVRAAAEEQGGETVAVVGHQPDCSRVAAALTGGEEPAFPPGGMLSIDLA